MTQIPDTYQNHKPIGQENQTQDPSALMMLLHLGTHRKQ